jgi:hypothetical protein
MRHVFTHEFDDDPPHGDFDVDLDPPAGASIRFDVVDGEVWVSANGAGWLHLAKICAEMGLHSGFSPGYHFHRTRDWQQAAVLATTCRSGSRSREISRTVEAMR